MLIPLVVDVVSTTGISPVTTISCVTEISILISTLAVASRSTFTPFRSTFLKPKSAAVTV